MPSPSSTRELLRPLAHARRFRALLAGACAALGIAAIAGTGIELAGLATLLGVALLIAGFLDAIDGLAAEPGDASQRLFAVLLAVVALIAALICLRHPRNDLPAIVMTVGIYLIVAGSLRLAGPFDEVRPGVERVLGGLDVVLGTLILALPALSLRTFAPLAGAALLARGAAALVEALRLRSAATSWSAARTPPTHG